jgi:hypothetical protein
LAASVLFTPAAAFGEDAGVTSAAYLSWVLWFLGFPDQALSVSAQSVLLARQLGHPFSLAYALTFATILHCRLRWPCKVTVKGSTSCSSADATQAAMGGVTLVVLGPLVDAKLGLGDFAAALSASDLARASGKAIGDHHLEAELQRLRGESLLGLGAANESEAETCFAQALAISRQQQAKSLELRAAISMARLWQQQGKRDAACGLLTAVFGWFTEGFDTPDLRLARELLQALNA